MAFFDYFNYTFLVVVTIGLMATVGDVTLTWTSPVIQKIKSNDTSVNPLGRPITGNEESWIGSLIYIGAMIGSFPFSFIADKFGRKPAMLCLAIPHIAAFLMFAFGKDVIFYYVARWLGGIALGASYTLLPMYIAEIAEDSNRGMLSVTLNIFWTFGNLLPYILGAYLDIIWFNIILACLPVGFLVVFFIIGRETPYYLISVGRNDEAANSLKKFRNTEKVKIEIENIRAGLEGEKDGNLMDLFKSATNLKALGICFFLVIGQQLSGIDAILVYTSDIMESAGITGLTPDESSMIIGAVLFLSSMITPFVIERLGRKLLLMISALGMALSHSVFGIYFFLDDSTTLDVSNLYWLPLVSVVLFIIMYNIGLGSIPWTITSELFPSHVKSTAALIVSLTCWITSFLVTQFFEDMKSSLGQGETFWFFGGCCALTLIFAYFYVPETKGKSFTEIQKMLQR